MIGVVPGAGTNVWVGSIHITPVFEASFTWEGASSNQGSSAASLKMQSVWDLAEAVRELAQNPRGTTTIAGHAAVMTYIWTDDVNYQDFNGFYQIDAVTFSPDDQSSLSDRNALVEFTIRGLYLGDFTTRQVVISRTAGTRANSYGLVGVASTVVPFWDENPAGGDPLVVRPPAVTMYNREYDPNPFDPTVITPALPTRQLSDYVDSPVAVANTPVMVPEFSRSTLSIPGWVRYHGINVCLWDRRLGREVHSEQHSFKITTDCMMSNGLVSFWVGNRLQEPFVNVRALIGGSWREVGCLFFPNDTEGKLLGVRIGQQSHERSSVVLSVKGQGDITLTLVRGHRMIYVEHGSNIWPVADVNRYLEWRGAPPIYIISGVTQETGAFNQGIRVHSGDTFQTEWTPTVSKNSWAISFKWKPDAASTSQANSGLLTIVDSTDSVSHVAFTASSKKIAFVIAGQIIETPALTFTAGQVITVTVAFSSVYGMGMTVTMAGGATFNVESSTNTNPGTTDSNYSGWLMGQQAVAQTLMGFGDGDFGSGGFGGIGMDTVYAANGVVDNWMQFESFVTGTERVVLGTASTALGGLPQPLARLVAYYPFDARLAPLGSALTGGRRYEATASGGVTRSPDSSGLTKALLSLSPAWNVDGKMNLGSAGTQAIMGAALATTNAGDDLANYQDMLAAQCKNKVMVR